MRTLPPELKGPVVEAQDPVEQRVGNIARQSLTPVRGEFNHRVSAPLVPVLGSEERVSLPDLEPLPGSGQARLGQEPVLMARASRPGRARVRVLGPPVPGLLRAQVWEREPAHAGPELLLVREWVPLVPVRCHRVTTQRFPQAGPKSITAAIGVPV